jgi:3-phosphoshikimate 1-carboxyvinyltransferase
VTIDGDARMRERPIGELVGLLRRLGVEIEERAGAGLVPLRVSPGRPAGGAIEVGPTLSSQYVSALLLIGPWLADGVEVRFTSRPTSPSYVLMTASLLERLGARVEVEGTRELRAVRVAPGPLRGFELEIEPDASGATYFWAAGAVLEGSMVTVEGVGAGSAQGDAGFVELLARMGATVLRSGDSTTVAGQRRLRGIEADLRSMPDAAMSLAAAACFATGPTTMRGLRTLRVKETDRIEAMRVELEKVGVEARSFDDGDDEGLEIVPPEGGLDCRLYAPAAEIETYDDHRMAMSMAVLGLRRPVMRIRDPGCVAKTYPTFWRDWALLYGEGPEDA